ncbi:MAG: urease accessory protein UreH [Acidobacteria bacterium]|nr:urease accessory protein UreH [Acidobacteriota bacterium]
MSPGDFPIWSTLALGFVLGLRHALDADHLAAVSTFASEEKSLFRSSMIGVSWGMGHTAALLAFGMAIAAFRLALTPRLSQVLEFIVGLMLISLGVSVLFKLGKGSALHAHAHAHDGVEHKHLHVHVAEPRHEHQHQHQHRTVRLAGRPFMVGVVHGLAGTAALMMLVVGTLPSLLLAAAYILIFGVGSIGGMVVMSVLISVPLALATGRLRLFERGIRVAAGLFSLGFGGYLTWEVGLIQLLVR